MEISDKFSILQDKFEQHAKENKRQLQSIMEKLTQKSNCADEKFTAHQAQDYLKKINLPVKKEEEVTYARIHVPVYNRLICRSLPIDYHYFMLRLV